MSFNRAFIVVCSFVLIGAFCSESFAQRPGQRQPLRRAGKFAGFAWGSGNHWRNPMVNPGYYNPWTSHNSTYYNRGYGNEDGLLPGGENTFQFQHGTQPFNSLPGEVINVEVEAQPTVAPEPPANPPAAPPNEPSTPESGDSISGWQIDKSKFDETNLFERPVMSQPKFKPTAIDDSFNQKIQDLKNNNFWNEK